MKKQDKNIMLFGAIAVGAIILLGGSKGGSNANNTPQCPPGYFWNGSTCQKIPATGGGTSNTGGGSVWSSIFNSLPGIIDSTGNLVNAIQSNQAPATAVGHIYQMRY